MDVGLILAIERRMSDAICEEVPMGPGRDVGIELAAALPKVPGHFDDAALCTCKAACMHPVQYDEFTTRIFEA